MTNVERVQIGDIPLDRLTMAEAVDAAFENLSRKSNRALIIETVNAQFVCLARKMKLFSELVSSADMVVADGISVVAASRMLGKPCPERVAGVDLLVRICEKASETGATVYFLGGRPGAAQKASERLIAAYHGLKVVGVECPAVGFDKDLVQTAEVLNRIMLAGPDFLFVGLGAPKQEIWINQYAVTLPVKTMIGVGGSFEMLAGIVQRAPKWIQQAGLEWAYRLVQDPRRLWKRYVFGNAHFLAIVAMQWAKQAIHNRRTAPAASIGEEHAEVGAIPSKRVA